MSRSDPPCSLGRLASLGPRLGPEQQRLEKNFAAQLAEDSFGPNPFRGNPHRRSCPRTTGPRRLRTGTDRGTAVSPELNPEPSRCARQPGARPRAEAGTRGSTQRRRVRVQNRAGVASRGLHPEHRSREPSDRPRATPIIRRRPVPGLARTRTSTGHLGHASCAGKWSFTSPHEEVLVWCGNVWGQSEGISFFLRRGRRTFPAGVSFASLRVPRPERRGRRTHRRG